MTFSERYQTKLKEQEKKRKKKEKEMKEIWNKKYSFLDINSSFPHSRYLAVLERYFVGNRDLQLFYNQHDTEQKEILLKFLTLAHKLNTGKIKQEEYLARFDAMESELRLSNRFHNRIMRTLELAFCPQPAENNNEIHM